MANKSDVAVATTQESSYNNNERRWYSPRKRAESYANERKAKVHQGGPKEGQALTEYEKGLRSGYLQCQSDHAGEYKYKRARDEGYTKEESAAISKSKTKYPSPYAPKN